MGKSGKLLLSLVNGVKALRSPSTREKPAKEPSSAKKERDISAVKQKCWSLGKSSSRNRGSACTPPSPGFDVVEVKDVQMHIDLSDNFQPGIPSLHYTSDSVERSPARSVDDVVKLEPVPQSLCDVPQQEDWAAVLKLTDHSEPENKLVSNGPSNMTSGIDEIEREEQAAILIQAAFRRHQAQRHFRALNAVIRLQALVRARRVRKQAAMTRQCIHALVKFQAYARGWRIRKSELGRLVQRHLQEARQQEWEPSDTQELGRRKEEMRKLLDCALNEQQLHSIPSKQPSRPIDFEPDKDHWGWAWLDRWMAAQPWENSGSPAIVRKEAARMSVPARHTEKNIIASEGSMDRTMSRSTNLLNASIEHGIPLPPPPPQLLSVTAAAHTPLSPVKLEASIVEETPLSTPLPKDAPSQRNIMQSMPTSEVYAGDTSGDEVTSLQPLLNDSRVIRESTPLSDDVCSAETATSPEIAFSMAAEGEQVTVVNPNCELKAEQEKAVISTSRPASSPQDGFMGKVESPSAVRTTGKMREWQERITILHIPVLENEGLEGAGGQEVDIKDDILPDETPGMDNVNGPTSGGIGMAEDQPEMDIDPKMSVDHVLTEETASGMNLDGKPSMNLACEEKIGKETDGDVVDSSKNVIKTVSQAETNDVTMLDSPKISRAPSKRMSSIALKHEHNEGGSVPSYMATTKSSKAKARSHASPRPMPESPTQRLASPKQRTETSASKRTPGSEGKGTSPRPIVHVRAGSKGQLASISNTDASSRALGGSKRHSK